MLNEWELIEQISKKVTRQFQGKLGIGDDAELFHLRGPHTVISCDSIVENVDFVFSKTTPELVGRKILAVNLSDMAAMGAQPAGYLMALGLPKKADKEWIDRFYSGFIKLSSRYRLRCWGGDLSRSEVFFASLTILGTPAKGGVISRKGARPGDWIAVTGFLGGSISERHLSFEPRIHEGIYLAGTKAVTSMIDISDGFLQDLDHILRQSKAGACLDISRIPVSDSAWKLAGGRKERALERALSDGEDFELLFTVHPEKRASVERLWKEKFPRLNLSWIGKITAAKHGVAWYNGKEKIAPPKLKQKGYSHF